MNNVTKKIKRDLKYILTYYSIPFEAYKHGDLLISNLAEVDFKTLKWHEYRGEKYYRFFYKEDKPDTVSPVRRPLLDNLTYMYKLKDERSECNNKKPTI